MSDEKQKRKPKKTQKVGHAARISIIAACSTLLATLWLESADPELALTTCYISLALLCTGGILTAIELALQHTNIRKQ